MANVKDALTQDLNDFQNQTELEAKKKALKKRQQDPEYYNPKCTPDELKDIFGG